MKLNELIDQLKRDAELHLGGARPTGAEITDICHDSRKAEPDSLFVCIRGYVSDGHAYAAAAYQNGARAFLAEHPLDLPADACVMLCPDTRRALAVLADAIYGHPAQKLHVIGITGTKGKTSTALMIHRILDALDLPSGYIGTNGVDF